GGGNENLRDAEGTMMGRLVLADSREAQDLVVVAFRRHEVKKGGLSESEEATGEACDVQPKAPSYAAIFATPMEWRGADGNLSDAELAQGFASTWKGVIMARSPQQLAALAPCPRWKVHEGKPGKGKGDRQTTTGTDEGLIMYAVELSHMYGTKLAALLCEAMKDMAAVCIAGPVSL
ncbi:unnamed protein product, partial [Prorocentrum cordatum]